MMNCSNVNSHDAQQQAPTVSCLSRGERRKINPLPADSFYFWSCVSDECDEDEDEAHRHRLSQGLCGSQAQVFFIFESGVGANSCDCAVMLRG